MWDSTINVGEFRNGIRASINEYVNLYGNDMKIKCDKKYEESLAPIRGIYSLEFSKGHVVNFKYNASKSYSIE